MLSTYVFHEGLDDRNGEKYHIQQDDRCVKKCQFRVDETTGDTFGDACCGLVHILPVLSILNPAAAGAFVPPAMVLGSAAPARALSSAKSA